jgi:hypothetical protein
MKSRRPIMYSSSKLIIIDHDIIIVLGIDFKILFEKNRIRILKNE